MRKIIGLFILATTGILCTATRAQQTKILTADKHNEYGLVYTLPTTAMRIEVTAERTVNTAGPYYQYAKKFLRVGNAITEDSEQWRITEVKVTPIGISDTEKKYLMQLKPGALTYISVSDNGMLLAINKEVGTSAPQSGDKSLPVTEISGKGRNSEEPVRRVNPNDYLKYVNEDFLASQSSAKQAQMLAESIMEVRDSKVSLTRGTAETMPTDGRQLELMLKSLTHQEAALTAAFTGTTETTTETRGYMYTPVENGSDILFRMSDFAGFVDAGDYSGDPVNITVDITREAELPVDNKGEEKKLPKDAVIYAIPGTAQITLEHKGNVIWSGEMEFAQFGTTFGLAPNLFSDKRDRSYATFSPVTGALVEIGSITEE
ncbi:MAG: DUF4831 family protein [Candidatus Amulumruptor caecigallinarius]|nr:DUF4831 family protein [Candidatus Amulumruptor caecigallinarius]